MSLKKQPSTVSMKRNSLSTSQKQLKSRSRSHSDADDWDDFLGVCKSVYISQLNDLDEEITTIDELLQCKYSGIHMYFNIAFFTFFKKMAFFLQSTGFL